MPPKASSAETAELIELFKSIGLTQSKAAEAAKNPKSASTLKEIIEKKSLAGKALDEKTSVLLAAAAVQGSKLDEDARGYVVDAILDGRLKTTDQVSGKRIRSGTSSISICLYAVLAAAKYMETHPAPVDDADFDKQCGVGAYPCASQWHAVIEALYNSTQDSISLLRSLYLKLRSMCLQVLLLDGQILVSLSAVSRIPI